MQRLDVRLDLAEAGVLRFKDLDDFHPDRLFGALELFRGLRELRQQIANPESFQETAAELLAGADEAPIPRRDQPPPIAEMLTGPSLLDQIVEGSENPSGAATVMSRKADPLQKYINQIVAPYVVAQAHPKQTEMLEKVDTAISASMRDLLHERSFQALEAAWRALDFLIRRVDTDTDLKIYVLNVSKKTLAQDLVPAADLRSTSIYRTLVDETVNTPGAEPWALVAANYTFGPGDDDIDLLGRIALLASAAECAVVARADAALLGDAGELAAWNEFQKIPETRYVGLALPGFLLRLPYGKETSPLEQFPLEEMPQTPRHQEYLWGNPAFACAYLLADAFSNSGWEMRPGEVLDIESLPVHIYKKDGESVMKPCAEVLMTQSEAEALMERGLIPLLSMKGSDRIHVAGIRSIAGTPLAGRWE